MNKRTTSAVNLLPMAINRCPACGKPLAIEDINVGQGVVLCRSCGKLSRLADVADQPDVDPTKLANPPVGCSIRDSFGGDLVATASLRSVGGAIGTLVICLFWNGIVSIFVLIALSGLYRHFVGPLPEWFPTPTSGSHGKHGDGGEPLGMTLFMCVFLIPFVTIGTVLLLTTLTCIAGRVEVRISGTVGRVRTGIGPFNWTRRFDPTKVKRVADDLSTWSQNDQRKPVIQIETADRKIKFGSMLADYRRAWLRDALYVLLVAPGKDARRKLGMAAMARSMN